MRHPEGALSSRTSCGIVRTRFFDLDHLVHASLCHNLVSLFMAVLSRCIALIVAPGTIIKKLLLMYVKCLCNRVILHLNILNGGNLGLLSHLNIAIALRKRADAVVMFISTLIVVGSHLPRVHPIRVEMIAEKLSVLHIYHIGLIVSHATATFESVH